MRRIAGLVACVVLGTAAPAGAARGPDLAAFSGCVAAHSAVQGYDRGAPPSAATVALVSSSIRASRQKGARKVAKKVRRAHGAAGVEAAVRSAAGWCTQIGVPPITIPTTTPPPLPAG